MGAFSYSSRHGDGSRAWDIPAPAPAFALARRIAPIGTAASGRGWSTSIGVAPGGSASYSPTRERRSLGGGATDRRIKRTAGRFWLGASASCRRVTVSWRPCPMGSALIHHRDLYVPTAYLC